MHAKLHSGWNVLVVVVANAAKVILKVIFAY